MVLGTEKGADTEARVARNFGMARPEGYRKARRLMRLAERFALPVLSFVDTAGAFPGIDAEARGQSEAIARAIETCLDLRVPVIATIIGEGGSGGAIALAAGNTVLMLEHAIYSRDLARGLRLDPVARRRACPGRGRSPAADRAGSAAPRGDRRASCRSRWAAPTGGRSEAIAALGEALGEALRPLLGRDGASLRDERRRKFLAIGGTQSG